ncbi:MAG: putative transcriptional regulator, Crp/Fnr family [Caulobacter sp.]|nr:putative transcriptional regulator, Crp/Fnr family [Caulobacter sp.]
MAVSKQSDSDPAAAPAAPSANRLLAALRAADLAALRPHLTPIALTRGQVLFDAGDDVHTTYFPCHATMTSLLVVTRDGQEIEVATIGREGAVGGVVSSGFKPAFGRAVVTLPGAAFSVPTARLDALKLVAPALADLFARYADVLLAQMMQSVACNALHNIEQRCCRWLLSTHDRAGDHVIPLTQESLAEMLGVQRTTVTAVAKTLQDEGLIRYSRGRVEILDRPRMERRACECYAAIETHFARLLPEVEA